MYTHHGFCLNVRKNESYFDLIDPCGFPVNEVKPISIEEILKKEVPMQQVKDAITKSFKEVIKEDRAYAKP